MYYPKDLKWKEFISEWVYDPECILDVWFLYKIAKTLKQFEHNEFYPEIKWFDENDVDNLRKWYAVYQKFYSYETKNKINITDKQKKIIKKHEKQKWDKDLMSLIEISFLRLLENQFIKSWENVKIRKTSVYDDTFSGIDYIIEYLDDKWDIVSTIWVDLYSWNNEEKLEEKKERKFSTPIEYLQYRKENNIWYFWRIPRVVFHVDRNLLYSFTNNYFTEIYENWKILDSGKIDEVLNYSLEDLYNKWIFWGEKELFYKTKCLVSEWREKIQECLKN